MTSTGRVEITGIATPSNGQSSETYLLDLAPGAGGATRGWVLRVQPTGHQVYEDPSVERQFRMAETLSRRSTLPVPPPLAFEADPAWLGAPFFVMERTPGITPPDAYHAAGVLFEAPPAERERMWLESIALLAGLDALDPADFGFLAYPPAVTGDGIGQELARWDSFRRWADVPPDPVLDRARRWLDDHRPASPVGVAWGDARPCNILYDGGRCTGMLDWETASLGGAETDLGWWIFYDRLVTEGASIPRLEGIGGGAATIMAWEAAAGRKAMAMEWHIAFAGYRFAMIVERAGALARGAGGGRAANGAMALLATLLD